jgi:pimeloyl-ACP methyl ester carboxylesterase
VGPVIETDLTLGDGRTLRGYDTGGPGRPVFWLHGTPNLGPPPAPLFPAADRLGLRWLGYDRPGYGGSTRRPGRDVAAAAGDVAAVADALGITAFGVFGHSGGAIHALACAALLSDRVRATVAGCGLAPYGAAGLDWYAGMAEAGVTSMRAAAAGLAAREAYVEPEDIDIDIGFEPADWAALSGPWSWFGSVVGPALAGDPGGAADDDIASVSPWGFDPTTIPGPLLLLHGGADRMVPAIHGQWLASHIPAAELWLKPGDGHISVLDTTAEAALEWLAAHLA